MTRDEAFQLALGYACGREDAGEPLHGGVSRFCQAFADRQAAYNSRRTGYMPSVQAAWLNFREWGTIDAEARPGVTEVNGDATDPATQVTS